MILEAYKNITANRSTVYMLRQVLTVLALFAAGFIPIRLLRTRISTRWEALLSFPLGLSLYSVLGFLLLILGIRFNITSVIIAWLVVIAGVIIYRVRVIGMRLINNIWKDTLVFLILAIFAAIFACSGVLPQNVTNDSVYYYSVYPSILARDGFISVSLDKFLTDVGQTTAVAESLPFLLGFDETFGLQHFLNINFILIFFSAMEESLKKTGWNMTQRLSAALLSTLFLLTSEPFIVMSTWILSNVYFMDMFFIVSFLWFNTFDEDSPEYCMILFFTTSMLVMSRMEGGVMVFVLSLLISALPVRKRRLLLLFGVPMAVMVLGYYVNLYLKTGVDPLYSFLDIKSAALMAALILGYFVYIIFIRDRLTPTLIPLFLLLMLGLGNMGLLIINHERYITNIRAFILNIRLANGWGAFSIVIVIYAVLFIYGLFYGYLKSGFSGVPSAGGNGMADRAVLFLPLLMVLAVFAVCFARGGVLAVRTSDSGNRVLMEFVPLIVYCVIISIIRLKDQTWQK